MHHREPAHVSQFDEDYNPRRSARKIAWNIAVYVRHKYISIYQVPLEHSLQSLLVDMRVVEHRLTNFIFLSENSSAIQLVPYAWDFRPNRILRGGYFKFIAEACRSIYFQVCDWAYAAGLNGSVCVHRLPKARCRSPQRC